MVVSPAVDDVIQDQPLGDRTESGLAQVRRRPGSTAPCEKGPGLRLEWESSVWRTLEGSWRRAARPRRGVDGRPANVGYTPVEKKPPL